jgi:hypothetical protein
MPSVTSPADADVGRPHTENLEQFSTK